MLLLYPQYYLQNDAASTLRLVAGTFSMQEPILARDNIKPDPLVQAQTKSPLMQGQMV
uniref:Uncharacterized protein n=1 Tax=Solanum tuberosum TaxID=4113 RepID=M1A849_SOLTU